MDYGRPTLAWPSLTPGVKWLLIANAGVFVLSMLVVGMITSDPGTMARWFGVSWEQLIEGFGLGLPRLITYQFVHSFVSPFHILFNMLVLYMFGTMVEGSVGTRRLVWLYLASGVVGAVVEMVLQAAVGHHGPVIGASGACYGITIFAACLAPRSQVIFIIFPLQLRVLAWLLVGLGAYMTFINLTLGPVDATAHGAHLGGALWGYLTWRRRLWPDGLLAWAAELPQRQARRRAGRERERMQRDAEVLDRLLDKVHREGLSALTPAERRFLDRASRDRRGR